MVFHVIMPNFVDVDHVFVQKIPRCADHEVPLTQHHVAALAPVNGQTLEPLTAVFVVLFVHMVQRIQPIVHVNVRSIRFMKELIVKTVLSHALIIKRISQIVKDVNVKTTGVELIVQFVTQHLESIAQITVSLRI